MAESPITSGKASDADAERLFAVLLAPDAKGKPRFSDDEILTYLPLLMRSAGITPDASPFGQAIFVRVGRIIGATATDSDEALAKKLTDYFLAHPPSAALQDAFAVFCRAEAGVPTADAFKGFVGQVRAQAPVTPVSISSTHPAYEVIESKPKESK